MNSLIILIVSILAVAVTVEPVDAQEKARVGRQGASGQGTKSSFGLGSSSTAARPTYGRIGYGSLAEASGRGRGKALDGNGSEKQTGNNAVSPLLGGPRNYEDSYQASIEGRAGYDEPSPYQNDAFDPTPEELALARSYLVEGRRSSPINESRGGGVPYDVSHKFSKRANGDRKHGANHQSAWMSDFGYARYESKYGLPTGTDLYRSPAADRVE